MHAWAGCKRASHHCPSRTPAGPPAAGCPRRPPAAAGRAAGRSSASSRAPGARSTCATPQLTAPPPAGAWRSSLPPSRAADLQHVQLQDYDMHGTTYQHSPLQARVDWEGGWQGYQVLSPSLTSGALRAAGVPRSVRVPVAARRVARTTLPAGGGISGPQRGAVWLCPAQHGVWISGASAIVIAQIC